MFGAVSFLIFSTVEKLILASRIEQIYTKQQILELYFNKVYFGDGLYGAEAAARGYFGKHAAEFAQAYRLHSRQRRIEAKRQEIAGFVDRALLHHMAKPAIDRLVKLLAGRHQ